jgi:hypothetical protein
MIQASTDHVLRARLFLLVNCEGDGSKEGPVVQADDFQR